MFQLSKRRDGRNSVRAGTAIPLCAILAGLALGAADAASAADANAAPPSASAVVAGNDAAVSAFLTALRRDALAGGVSPATFDAAFAGFSTDPEVIARSGSQLEHERTVQDYLALLVSAERIEAGRAKLAENAAALADIERRFGVDRHVVVAIWGVETRYGANAGSFSVIRSLATLAMADERRGAFWRAELVAALKILQRGDIAPARMTGSWAGAMGHTQFMPTTYIAHAADHDGDGRRDIWDSSADALASAARYLNASGWKAGEPWGLEVNVPAGFDYALSAPEVTKRLPEWQALGLSRPTGQAWPAPSGELRLLLPAGAGGPALLVTGNFRAILRYNASIAYALAVGMLADRIAGRQPLVAAWPAGERALSRAEREEMQRALTALGHDTGGVDGIIGRGSRAAIRAYQKTRAMAEDGHPSEALLVRLRQEASR